MKKEGYVPHTENVAIGKVKGFRKFTRDVDLFKAKDVQEGDSFTLDNIFYDFDKATLRPASIVEIENLISILNKNKTWKIEIANQFIIICSNSYNKSLSARRAKSVVDYLIKHGIPKTRLTYKGYGETSTRVSDAQIAAMKTKKEKEAGHQLNRRTEFKLLQK